MEYKKQVQELLNDFKAGKIDNAAFLEKLRSSEYSDLGFAMIDHERSLRQGFAEVVYCEGKTAEQTAAIMARQNLPLLKRLCRMPNITRTPVLLKLNAARCRRTKSVI